MAKIDTRKIKGYEEMTPEEKLKALESYEYDDYLSETERLKNAISKANSDAAEWKRKHNALLDDESRKKQEDAEKMASMEKELNELRREKTISEYTSKYIALGYAEELASATAKALADGDMEKVFANQQSFLTGHDKQLKADGLKSTPRPPAGEGGKGMTRDEIMKIRDHTERQAAIAENIDLFRKE